MSWKENKEKADKFENAIIEFCDNNCIYWAQHGQEKVPSSCFDRLPNNDDPTTFLVRNFPDFVLVIAGETWLLDAKAGETVSRKAYEAYMKLAEQKYRVGLLIGPPDAPRYVDIREVKFREFKGTLPCDGGQWVNPSKLTGDDQWWWKERNGSLQAFARIDCEATLFKKLK